MNRLFQNMRHESVELNQYLILEKCDNYYKIDKTQVSTHNIYSIYNYKIL